MKISQKQQKIHGEKDVKIAWATGLIRAEIYDRKDLVLDNQISIDVSRRKLNSWFLACFRKWLFRVSAFKKWNT